MILLIAASGKRMEEILRDDDLYAPESVIETYRDLIRRRKREEPLAYLLGEWEFRDLEFYVDKTALIPRYDTKMLAALAISELKKLSGKTRLLDLCAGTGCVGISIAWEVKTCRAVLVELANGPLELCKRNIRRHRLTGRVVQLKGDVKQPPSPALGQFDVVVCNPPYIPTGEIPMLDASVRDYEPWTALDGGEDGLDFYRAIFAHWTSTLKPGGCLALECGEGQSEALRRFGAQLGMTEIAVFRDTGGTERALSFRRPEAEEAAANAAAT